MGGLEGRQRSVMRREWMRMSERAGSVEMVPTCTHWGETLREAASAAAVAAFSIAREGGGCA